MLKDTDFDHLRENIKQNYWIRDALKAASKKVIHKTSKFIENKIADAVTKSKYDKILKQEPVEEIIIPPEIREQALNGLRQVLL